MLLLDESERERERERERSQAPTQREIHHRPPLFEKHGDIFLSNVRYPIVHVDSGGQRSTSKRDYFTSC